MSPEELLGKYEGHIVPQRLNPGFVVLSYIVSLIGAGSTLELINRRTGSKGLFNKLVTATFYALPANARYRNINNEDSLLTIILFRTVSYSAVQL
jgi:hypothetical protein